jgi:hypothetical protein
MLGLPRRGDARRELLREDDDARRFPPEDFFWNRPFALRFAFAMVASTACRAVTVNDL